MVAGGADAHTGVELMRTPELTHSAYPLKSSARPQERIRVRDMARAATGGIFPGHGDMADAEVILAFDFGSRSNPDVSTSNRELGEVLERWPDVPILAQPEIATVLARGGRLAINIDAEARRRLELPVDAYVDTAFVVRAACALVTDAGWSRVGVVAHPTHVLRCLALLEARGITTVAPALTTEDVGFDPESKQWWTRSQRLWAIREWPVLVHHSLGRTFRPT